MPTGKTPTATMRLPICTAFGKTSQVMQRWQVDKKWRAYE